MTRLMTHREVLAFMEANKERILSMEGVNGCGVGILHDWESGNIVNALRIYVEYVTPQTLAIQRSHDFEDVPTEVVQVGRIEALSAIESI